MLVWTALGLNRLYGPPDLDIDGDTSLQCLGFDGCGIRTCYWKAAVMLDALIVLGVRNNIGTDHYPGGVLLCADWNPPIWEDSWACMPSRYPTPAVANWISP